MTAFYLNLHLKLVPIILVTEIPVSEIEALNTNVTPAVEQMDSDEESYDEDNEDEADDGDLFYLISLHIVFL
jgi:hypothetical protein